MNADKTVLTISGMETVAFNHDGADVTFAELWAKNQTPENRIHAAALGADGFIASTRPDAEVAMDMVVDGKLTVEKAKRNGKNVRVYRAVVAAEPAKEAGKKAG